MASLMDYYASKFFNHEPVPDAPGAAYNDMMMNQQDPRLSALYKLRMASGQTSTDHQPASTVNPPMQDKISQMIGSMNSDKGSFFDSPLVALAAGLFDNAGKSTSEALSQGLMNAMQARKGQQAQDIQRLHNLAYLQDITSRGTGKMVDVTYKDGTTGKLPFSMAKEAEANGELSFGVDKSKPIKFSRRENGVVVTNLVNPSDVEQYKANYPDAVEGDIKRDPLAVGQGRPRSGGSTKSLISSTDKEIRDLPAGQKSWVKTRSSAYVSMYGTKPDDAKLAALKDLRDAIGTGKTLTINPGGKSVAEGYTPPTAQPKVTSPARVAPEGSIVKDPKGNRYRIVNGKPVPYN